MSEPGAPAAAAAVAPAPPPPSWPRRLLGPALGVAVFAGVAAGADRFLRAARLADVGQALAALPPARIALALALVVAQHLLLAVREGLAVAYAGRPTLGARRVLLASLISRSLSQLGVGTVTAFGLRYRIYTGWGLSTVEVGRITAYNELTYYVGLAATVAVVLGLGELPAGLVAHVPPPRLVGGVALAAHLAYLAACARRTSPVRLGSLSLELPRGGALLAQTLLPLIDTALGVGAAYACLPAGAIGLPAFAVVFVVAGLAGAASQVPGGLGVFEGVVLWALAGAAPTEGVLAGLAVRRAVTMLLPVMVGALLLFALEVRRGRGAAARHPWLPDVLADGLAALTFASGVLLLLLAVAPHGRAALDRAGLLGDAALVAAGVATLAVARGLQHRRRAAWRVAVALLAGQAALGALAGLGWSALAASGPVAGLLLAGRRHFTAGGVAYDDHVGWRASLAIALIGTGWVGLAADGAPWSRRFLFEATAAIAVTAVLVAAALVRRPRAGGARAGTAAGR